MYEKMNGAVSTMPAVKLRTPKILYGIFREAGRGWPAIARRVWRDGWHDALADVEWMDLLNVTHRIVLDRRPQLVISPELRSEPYFAAYRIHEDLVNVAIKETGEDRAQRYFRLRALVLEALDWPWFHLGLMRGGFDLLPAYDPLASEQDWKIEQKAIATQALTKFMQCFDAFARMDARFSYDGLMRASWPSPFSWVIGALRHCIALKLCTKDEEIWALMRLPVQEVKQVIVGWMMEQGLPLE